MRSPGLGVTTSLEDDSLLRDDLEHAARLGFTGKLCIHPRQVAVANDCLTPSDEEIEGARQTVATAPDGAATRRDGQMIDHPVVLRAKAILARADHLKREGRRRAWLDAN
jgi:citrate lyase subunit beta / citryl-CoA lyase